MLYWTVPHKDEDPEIHAEYIGLYVKYHVNYGNPPMDGWVFYFLPLN